jgi:hypothetical protein
VISNVINKATKNWNDPSGATQNAKQHNDSVAAFAPRNLGIDDAILFHDVGVLDDIWIHFQHEFCRDDVPW